ETFSSTNLGLSQFTTDTFVGDTGDTSSFGCAAFSGYDNDTIYVGRGQRNSATLGHNIIKIDCSAQTASIHYGSSTSATGGCVPGLANSSNMYFPSSSGTQSLVTLSKSTDTYTVSNPFSGFVAFAPGAKASNGDMYWAPNTAAGMCRVTSGGTASLQTLGGRLTGSDNKCSGCALGPDDHIYIWPRGTASRRTFYELTPSTMVVEDWFADWWFTSGFGDQPQSGPINDDYNFFFPPGNTNQDQLMVGGFREPSSPAVPAILRPEMHVSESGPHFKYPPGLLEPFILYDMRNYDGDFVLHNEGTAGDIWDLNVWSNAFTQSGTTWRSFGGYQGWRKEDSYLYDHHWGGPWIGLPFTIVVALGPMDNADDNPNSQFINAYMETSFNIPQVWLDAIYDKSVGSSYQDDHYYGHYQFVGLDSYMELDLQDAAWRIGADNPPPWRDDLKGKATILYINPMTGGANVWINGSIISPQTADYHNTVPGSAETGHTEYWSDLAGDALYDDPFPIGRYFWYGIDFHAEASSGPVSWPVSPKAAIGFAFIRGEPTEEDIAYWTEYFYV
ncbi:MAG TPA: hypothetical protein VGK47_06525, partial [Nitrososphaeraceae archaeon]